MKKIIGVLLLAAVMGVNAASAAANEYVTDMLQEIAVPYGMDYVVVDVLDEVEARYRAMTYPDITGEYSCAGYVKKYYQAVYGIDVQNLTDTGPPSPAELFRQVHVPQKGDIIFFPSPPNKNNHNAIVKTFDGQHITLIEQNYKWTQSGGTYTYINRTIPFPPDATNQYEIWRLIFVPDEPETEYPVSPAPYPVVPAYPDAPVAAIPDPAPAVPQLIYESVVMIGRMAITVNGEDMETNAPALIENERTVMPVRYVSYALGISPDDIVWNETDRTVTIYNEGNVIGFTIDSNVLYINGEPVFMDAPATIKSSGYSYLPVAYLAAALNVDYEWFSFSEFNRGVVFHKYR